jgi:hypothetical protein
MSDDSASAAQASPSIDPIRLQMAVDQLRTQQSLPAGLLAGLAAAAVGAAIWAGVTVALEVQIGWMAVGVGFLVGLAVRAAGKGLDPIFGYAGAALALLGCLAGNLLAGCGFLASEQSVPLLDVLLALDTETVQGLMVAMFSPIDLLFYGIALYEGRKLSIRQVTQDQLLALTGERVGG